LCGLIEAGFGTFNSTATLVTVTHAAGRIFGGLFRAEITAYRTPFTASGSWRCTI
jgi:hypothetical protein